MLLRVVTTRLLPILALSLLFPPSVRAMVASPTPACARMLFPPSSGRSMIRFPLLVLFALRLHVHLVAGFVELRHPGEFERWGHKRQEKGILRHQGLGCKPLCTCLAMGYSTPDIVVGDRDRYKYSRLESAGICPV